MNIVETKKAVFDALMVTMSEQFDLEGSVRRLQEFPEKIRKQQMILTAAQSAMAEAKEKLELAKATLLMEISEEVNDKGKPKFSNEAARSAELKRRAAGDLEYSRCLEAYREAENNYNDAKFDLDRLHQECSVTKELIRLAVAKMQLMGAV